MWRSLRVAIGFLTKLPVSPKEFYPDDLGKSIKFFPIIGIIYGMMTWGLLQLLPRLTTVQIAVWMIVFANAFLNGFIHWDGFADSADGLGSYDPQKSLSIMKDSRLGAFGGIALIFIISGKIFALQGLTTISLPVFISIAVLARWVMAVQIYTQPSVSQGLLKAFESGKKPKDIWIVTLLMLCLLAFAWPVSLILLGVALLSLIILDRIIINRFGGITGDILGASNEMVELTCLVVLNFQA